MAEKKARKKIKKESAKEIQNKIEAEKIVFEKAKEAEEIQEKKEEEEKPSKETLQKESKMLRNILLVLGLIAVVIAFILILNNVSRNFVVDGVKYSVDEQGQLTFYNTNVPVIYNGSLRNYVFHLYNDPRVIQKEIPFNGSIKISTGTITVMNITGDINCNSDGILAVANLVNLYNLMGRTINDKNATCSPTGQYNFINIQESNETSIQQIGPGCYNINIHNCQVLRGTERFMIETFATIHNLSASK